MPLHFSPQKEVGNLDLDYSVVVIQQALDKISLLFLTLWLPLWAEISLREGEASPIIFDLGGEDVTEVENLNCVKW